MPNFEILELQIKELSPNLKRKIINNFEVNNCKYLHNYVKRLITKDVSVYQELPHFFISQKDKFNSIDDFKTNDLKILMYDLLPIINLNEATHYTHLSIEIKNN